MTDLSKLTARQRENFHYMADVMRRLEWDLHNHIEATSRIPEEWHEIAQALHPRAKTRITMCIDDDVLKFFKSMGSGYQTRLNAVLRSYVHARLAGVIRGAESVDHYRHRQESHAGARPLWGDTARELGELPAATEAEKRRERMAQLREKMKLRKVME